MNDHELEKLLRTHHEPPDTPRDRMYARIQGARRQDKAPKATPELASRRWWPMAAALAAMLVLGVGLGRMSLSPEMPTASPTPPQAATATPADDLLYRENTQRLLQGADALLTDFRLEGCRSQQLPATTVWARSMLLQTRVLQSTPSGRDPELGSLLADLEVILTQIVTIDPEQCDRDVDWIRNGLNERDTLGRLRTAAARAADADPL